MQETVEERVFNFLSSTLEDKACHLIVAYSGGPDSSVLLSLLKKFQNNFSYSLSAAYINHNIRTRDVMALECAAVHSYVDSLGVELLLKEYPPGFIEYYSKKTATGIEGAARNCRYHFFRKMQRRLPGTLIALGHNENDQLETLIMRLFQGTGTEGLKGISSFDNGLIRPILGLKRSEILSYASENNIPYVTDQTNSSGDYRRNRIRRDLLPVLYDIFPQPDKALLQFSEEVYDLGVSALQGVEWESCKEGWRFSEERFYTLAFAARKNFVLGKMNEMNKGILPADTRIPGRFFNPLNAEHEKGKNRILIRGYHIILEKYKGWVFLRKDEKIHTAGMFHLLKKNNPFHTSFFSLSLSSTGDGDSFFEIPVNHYLNVQLDQEGIYRVCDGSLILLKLDYRAKILFFLYENHKKIEKLPLRPKDCVIIKLEVRNAPG
ncbi:MAG: tRNA lysidine(34) synthetase TilS [Spirochaetaceae bacterium 4572_59]|nr:MAG: tRNA lysidine(34) synthetase TilS [Spirochaetaceae bacterium 4572_59]